MPAGTLYEYMITPPGGSSGYAANGNLLSYTDSVNGTWNFGFSGYDALNRLSAGTQTPVAGNGNPQSFCWTYDSFGNRTTQATSNQSFANAPGASTCQVASGSTLYTNTWASYTVNGTDPGTNRIASIPSGTYSYDGSGNVTGDTTNGYAYDGEGRLCAVATPQYSGGVVLTQYIYDAEGTRVGKGTNTNTSAGCDTSGTTFTLTNTYITGPSGEQLTETDGQGNWKHTNVYASGQLIATYDAGTNSPLSFHLSDWLGTRRVQTDYAGNNPQYFQGLPFGEMPVGQPLGATEQHFTAKERDTESGNDYFGARYYASTMGRFMSPDWSAKVAPVPYAKLDDPQSLNLYEYGRNNPLSNVDPDGHDFWDKLNNVIHGNGWKDTPPPPPPAPPVPPAAATPGTPQNNLINAQDAARGNPNFQPTGVPGQPGRTTHCNQATCAIVRGVGGSTNGLVDAQGNPNLANTDARTLANSPDYQVGTPQQAQDAANAGQVALGVAAADPNGHIVTVRPELIPGYQNVQQNGPLINNIGGSVGVTNANKVFRSETPTWYIPEP
jgi:RHS repeat-associated protein